PLPLSLRSLPSFPTRRSSDLPVIFVSLIGPSGTFVDRGLLDTGADDTLFPESVAAQIGVDLSNAPSGSGAGFGMHAAAVRYAEVDRKSTRLNSSHEWISYAVF